MKDYVGAVRQPRYIRSFMRDTGAIRARAGLIPSLMYALDRLIGLEPLHRVFDWEPLALTPVDAFPGARMLLSLLDVGISRDLLIHGTREVNAGRSFRSIIRPGDVIVDAGANIGWYTLMEAHEVGERGRVFAIEPVPGNFALLERNLSLNGFSERVLPVQAAVGDVNGEVDIHVARQSNLSAVRRTPIMERYVQFASSVRVPVVRIDDFLVGQGLDPSDVNIVRMDIEGFELEALRGMERVLSTAQDLALFIEIHPKLVKEIHGLGGYQRMLHMLRENGFFIDSVAFSLDSRVDQEADLDWAGLEQAHEAVEVIFRKA